MPSITRKEKKISERPSKKKERRKSLYTQDPSKSQLNPETHRLSVDKPECHILASLGSTRPDSPSTNPYQPSPVEQKQGREGVAAVPVWVPSD